MRERAESMERNWESMTSRQTEGGILINHYAKAEGFVGRNRNTEKEEMNKTKFRCLSLALAISVVALLGSGVAFAGTTHTTGFNVTKTCPMIPVAQGATYSCDFAITNQDPDHAVTLLSVTNTFPWISAGNPGNGTPTAVACNQGGSPVTQLGPLGSGTATCGGNVIETAPETCNPENEQVNDRIAVSGTDQGPPPFTGLPASGSATNGPTVLGQVCNDGEFCRTAGFWSTHTDSTGEKTCAQNITQAVLDAGGPLTICGELICNTEVDDASSAVEAMCVAVQGQQERQLARQLTAAGLNCIVTNGSATCDGVSINDAFDACNLVCDGDTTNNPAGYTVGGCIAQIDCFNNGGVWDPADGGSCSTGTCSNDSTQTCTQDDLSNCGVGAECIPYPNNCHEAEFGDFENVVLPNDTLLETDECFEKQGPADNADCKGAKKTDCTVIPPGEAECDTESACVLD